MKEVWPLESRSYTEICVALLVMVISVIFWIQANDLPPGTFEPLGSGPVPLYTASIIILCCLLVILRAVRSLRREIRSSGKVLKEEFSGGSPLGGILMLGGSVVYVGLLHLQVASFGLISFGFLTLLILAMERFQTRKIPTAVIIAALFAFGAEYLFTNVFTVDLPT